MHEWKSGGWKGQRKKLLRVDGTLHRITVASMYGRNEAPLISPEMEKGDGAGNCMRRPLVESPRF